MATKTTTTLPTTNTAWGFYGTTRQHERGERTDEKAMAETSPTADAAFAEASAAVMAAFGATPVEARDFLDSRWGRHLADELIGSGRPIAWVLFHRGWKKPYATWRRAPAF